MSYIQLPDVCPDRIQAEAELSDKDKRETLDAITRQARATLLKELGLPTSIENDDERLKSLSPSFKAQLRLKSKEFLIDEEVSRRKYEFITFPSIFPP